MAPSAWANAALRLIIEVASFLLNDNSSLCPYETLTSLFNSLKSSSTSQGLVDQLLSSLASTLSLPLPQSLFAFSGLPVATAYILRLTEVIPPEFVLWIIICGLIFVLLVSFGMIFAVLIGLVFLVLRCTLSTGNSHRVTSTPTTSDSAPPASSAPPLSDTAQIIAPTVASTQSNVVLRPRRPRRRDSPLNTETVSYSQRVPIHFPQALTGCLGRRVFLPTRISPLPKFDRTDFPCPRITA